MLGHRPNRSADTDSLSGHLRSPDIKVAPTFCGERIGLFKDTTGGGGVAVVVVAGEGGGGQHCQAANSVGAAETSLTS